VRFGLIENEHRTRQAVKGIKHMIREDARAADARPTPAQVANG